MAIQAVAPIPEGVPPVAFPVPNQLVPLANYDQLPEAEVLRAQRLIVGIAADINSNNTFTEDQKRIILQSMSETINRMALERAFFAGTPVNIRMNDITFNVTNSPTMEETIRNSAIGSAVGTVVGQLIGANPLVGGAIGMVAYGITKLAKEESCTSWLENFFSSSHDDNRDVDCGFD